MSHGLLSPISLVPSAWSALPLPTHPSQSYPCIVSVSEGDCNFPFRCDCARIFFFFWRAPRCCNAVLRCGCVCNREYNKRRWLRQINKSMIRLIERAKIIVQLVRNAFWFNFFDVVSQKTTRKFQIWGSSDNEGPRCRKSFILCFYMKTVRANHLSKTLRQFCTTCP